MQALLLLASLLTAASAQQQIYCNSSSAGPIRLPDFVLVIRPDPTDEPSKVCEFSAETESAAFYLEFGAFDTAADVLTVRSDGRQLFKGSRLLDYQSAMVTPSKYLEVRFNSAGGGWNRGGVTVRVRAFDANRCPPDWAYITGSCFGTSGSGRPMSYARAQKACNSMRSNLLEIPAYYIGSIGQFMRSLPRKLRSGYNWIGLTDRSSAGQFIYYWLGGARLYATSEISCVSGGNHRRCFSTERCGSFNDASYQYAVYMANCARRFRFVCSMPAGGTGVSYSIPAGTQRIVGSAVVWGSICASLLIVCMMIAGSFGLVHARDHCNRRKRVLSNCPTPAALVSLPTVAASVREDRMPSRCYSDTPPDYQAAVDSRSVGFLK